MAFQYCTLPSNNGVVQCGRITTVPCVMHLLPAYAVHTTPLHTIAEYMHGYKHTALIQSRVRFACVACSMLSYDDAKNEQGCN